jgi:hypothetical protein
MRATNPPQANHNVNPVSSPTEGVDDVIQPEGSSDAEAMILDPDWHRRALKAPRTVTAKHPNQTEHKQIRVPLGGTATLPSTPPTLLEHDASEPVQSEPSTVTDVQSGHAESS